MMYSLLYPTATSETLCCAPEEPNIGWAQVFHLTTMAFLPLPNPTCQTQLLGQAVVCQLEPPHIL